MEQIDVLDFNLTLLQCRYYDSFTNGNRTQTRRVVYDYEIEYYMESDGGIEIDGQYVPFEGGSVNFRKPGQIVKGIDPYQCYGLCLDITGSRRHIPYVPAFGSAQYAQPRYENSILNAIPDKLPPDRCGQAGKIIKNIYDNFVLKDLLAVKLDLYRLLNELYHGASNTDPVFINYHTAVKKAVLYISSNFCSQIDIDTLAECAGLSKKYFHKVFKEAMGITPNHFILNLRLEKAKGLLCMTNLPIAQIGYECGFLNHVYFSYVFRRSELITPIQYRQQYLDNQMDS